MTRPAVAGGKSRPQGRAARRAAARAAMAQAHRSASAPPVRGRVEDAPSQLLQWPVQIKLVPVNAPYFHGAKPADRRGLHRLRLRRISTSGSCAAASP